MIISGVTFQRLTSTIFKQVGNVKPRLLRSSKRRANNDSTTFRALVGFNHRCWGFRFLPTGAVGKFGPVQARPRSLADTSPGENEYHKTGHDAMGSAPCFQDGRRRTTN